LADGEGMHPDCKKSEYPFVPSLGGYLGTDLDITYRDGLPITVLTGTDVEQLNIKTNALPLIQTNIEHVLRPICEIAHFTK